MTKRTLALSRESLTELTTDELTGVAAAAANDAATSPLKACVTDLGNQLSEQLSCRASCNSCWCSWDSC